MVTQDPHDVDNVDTDHHQAMPDIYLLGDERREQEAGGDEEEQGITHEGELLHLKGGFARDRASDDGGDEAGRAYELADSQLWATGCYGGPSGEEIGPAIAEGEKGDAGERVTHVQRACDGAQVDSEEVAGADADSGEEKDGPDEDDDVPSRRRRLRHTIEKLQIGDAAIVFVLAVLPDKRARFARVSDLAAWRGGAGRTGLGQIR